MDFKRSIKIYDKSVSACTFTSAALLLLCFLFSFDAQKGYFEGSFLPVTFCIVFVAGIVNSLVGITSFKKEHIIKTPAGLAGHKVGIALGATATILLGLLNLLFNTAENSTVLLLTSIGACSFGIYFLIIAAKGFFTYSKTKLICLFISTAFPVGAVLGNNSNYYRSINSVENILGVVFAICLLTYILYEGKYLYSGVHSKMYFSAMMLASHAGITLSSAYMLAYLLKAVNEETRFYQMLLVLVISVLIKMELDRFVKEAVAHTKEEWNEIESPPIEQAPPEIGDEATEETVDESQPEENTEE